MYVVFNGDGTNGTQTKTSLTDEVTIGDGLPLRTISVLIQDSRFINNQRSASGAITFVNKGVKTITITNVEFTGNLISRNGINKANAIFAIYLSDKVVDSLVRTIRNAFGNDPQLMANNKQLQQVVDDYNGTKHNAFKLRFSPKQTVKDLISNVDNLMKQQHLQNLSMEMLSVNY
ncbi:MAG: hypothetical protein EZS28_019713 [Streblomastix strix]|uniref:Uncharacterized protein n=1 Tax=Streblomastix strix TaxID=222440 RepID=A0A5J4VQ80_9EUKA|nr:MAG: hypothetical protein EZS28_019713 [Streblomastix strix]